MNPPSRLEVSEKLQQLVQESISREEVARWAEKWVIADDPPDMENDLWEALSFLASADLISTDRPFLYTVEDFERELPRVSNS